MVDFLVEYFVYHITVFPVLVFTNYYLSWFDKYSKVIKFVTIILSICEYINIRLHM